MTLLERFNTCNDDGWVTAGKDVQFKVIGDTLYFQCSHGKVDWRYNFRAAADVYTKSDVDFIGHEGFNELWESVRPIIEQLKFYKIVGYSLGGALAVRAHENFYHRMGFEPDFTFTFGCPPSILVPSRILRRRFSKLVNYHNPLDLVYWLPKIIGYEHVGECKTLWGKTKRPKGYNMLSWLSHHSQPEYRQRLSHV